MHEEKEREYDCKFGSVQHGDISTFWCRCSLISTALCQRINLVGSAQQFSEVNIANGNWVIGILESSSHRHAAALIFMIILAGNEALTSPSCHLLSFLHNLPSSTILPTPSSHDIPWNTILYEDSVRLQLDHAGTGSSHQDISAGTVEVPPFRSNQIDRDHLFLNVGAPIWALDVSPPYHLPSSVATQTRESETNDSQGAFVVLAVGIAPWSCPVSLSRSDFCQDPSVIQLWKISSNETLPYLAYGLVHHVS